MDHQVFEREGRLEFSWDVAKDYFAPGLMDELFSHYARILHTLSSGNALWDIKEWDRELEKSRFLKKESQLTRNIGGSSAIPNDRSDEILPESLQLEIIPAARKKTFSFNRSAAGLCFWQEQP